MEREAVELKPKSTTWWAKFEAPGCSRSKMPSGERVIKASANIKGASRLLFLSWKTADRFLI